jgi:hypothetical protein
VSARMDIRGVYRFSSLVKQNKKAKNYAVFCFAGKKKLLFYIYAVTVKQKIYKRSTNHYSGIYEGNTTSIFMLYIYTLYISYTSAHLKPRGAMLQISTSPSWMASNSLDIAC